MAIPKAAKKNRKTVIVACSLPSIAEKKYFLFPAISKTMSSYNERDFSSGSTPIKHLGGGGGNEGEVFNCKNKIHRSHNTLEGIRVLK